MKQLHAVAVATDETPLDEAPGAAEDRSASALASEEIPAPIREALEGRGFNELTVVQKAVLASEAAGRDLQVSSQTGSGKTVALGLVLAPRLLEIAREKLRSEGPRALVVVPTRELAVQVSGELRWLYAAVRGLTVECVTGGSSVGQERHRLSRIPTVVVGTPGRLLDHVRTGAVDCSDVEALVLDEADRMLDMGFREELESILEATPADRRTHLVSATFPTAIRRLANKYQNDPLAVQGSRLGSANEDIQHIGHLVRFAERHETIVNLLHLCEGERALVFVNTRAQASTLADDLAQDGFAAAPISGELEQAQRTRTLDSFRNGTTTVLVATDVAARGLDIPDVAMVVHTDAPMDSESYTHRAGRTGRAGNKGRSVLLVSPQRRKKVEFLIRRAKVSMQWLDAPTAKTVEKARAKRSRRRLREALTNGAAPSESQLAHAASLLEETDATTLVARLVQLCAEADKPPVRKSRPVAAADDRRRGPDRGRNRSAAGASRDRNPRDRDPRRDRAPRDTGRRDRDSRARDPQDRDSRDGTFRDRDSGDWGEPRRGGPRDSRYGDSGPRGGGPRDSGSRDRGRSFDDRSSGDRRSGDRGPRRMGARSTRFEINWGSSDGATPQRLLAMLCRRGDVTGRAIGAIDIDHRATSFEVADGAVRDFEEYALRPDSRDPHLVIRRFRG